MTSSPSSTADKRKTFRKLHDSGCFVIPHPWNVGSALKLRRRRCRALPTFHGLGMTKQPLSCSLRKVLRLSAVDGRDWLMANTRFWQSPANCHERGRDNSLEAVTDQ